MFQIAGVAELMPGIAASAFALTGHFILENQSWIVEIS